MRAAELGCARGGGLRAYRGGWVAGTGTGGLENIELWAEGLS